MSRVRRSLGPIGSSLAIAVVASPLSWLTQAPLALATVGCDRHVSVAGIDSSRNSSGDWVLRAGNGMNGGGLYLGGFSSTMSCIRVTSIYSFHDADNYEEMGALQAAPGSDPCADAPEDRDWYRFWFEEVAGTVYCSGTGIHQSENTFYVAKVYRSSSDTDDWILYWGTGVWDTLRAPVVTSGYPIAATERWNTTDSAYGKYDGPQVMKVDRSWQDWSGVNTFYDTDGGYGIDTYANGWVICKSC